MSVRAIIYAKKKETQTENRVPEAMEIDAKKSPQN